MSDLSEVDVHGPVETLRTEFAEWDAAKQAWQPPMHHTVLRFRPDGRSKDSEYHNPDGSTARSVNSYDEAGRLIETRFQTGDGPVSRLNFSYDGQGRLIRTINIDEKGTRRESETYQYDARGNKTKIQFHLKPEGDVPMAYDIGTAGAGMLSGYPGATVTTSYDAHDHPIETLTHDATHRLLQRIAFTYDGAGRLVKEEERRGQWPIFPGMEEAFKDATPEDRERVQATIEKAFGQGKIFAATAYAYDEKGRRVEKSLRMGLLSEDRTTYRFDDHDNPIEETSEGANRDVGLDEHGELTTSRESSHSQRTRLSYIYDAQENWTERIMSSIVEPAKDFQPYSIERRQITYYPAAAA